MIPIQFANAGMFQTMLQRILAEPIFDDAWLKMVGEISSKSIYFAVDSVPGIAMLSDILPGREATWTLVLFERPGKRYKALLRECEDVMREIFSRYKFIRMLTYTSALNKRSQAVARHLGFHIDGINRRALCIRGVIQDCISYSILPEEVNNGKTQNFMGLGPHPAGDARNAAAAGAVLRSPRPGHPGAVRVPAERRPGSQLGLPDPGQDVQRDPEAGWERPGWWWRF